MKSDLTEVPESRFEKRSKRWWQFWKKYRTHYKAVFTIRFMIKAASVDSELWFEGVQYSKPNSFSITWEAGAETAAPREYRQPDSSLDRHE
jgi:hypothetical protein